MSAADPPAKPQDPEHVAAGSLPPWKVADLPAPPRIRWSPRALVGPGLMMVGAAIGGGEWLLGPRVTGMYGGIVMWIALASLVAQVAYNLEVMRYTMYCGEPIFVGFFRLAPGPRFWTAAYLFIDFFGLWPYLASNAAIPLSAAFLGHLPGSPPTSYLSVEEVAARTGLPEGVVLELKEHPERFGSGPDRRPLPEPVAAWLAREERTTSLIGYGVFLLCFVPLIFGGKIYNSLEKLMVMKMLLVLGYLLFIGLFYVKWETWGEVFAGFAFLGKGADGSWGFRVLPELPPGVVIDGALLGAFAAIAGQGGMTNPQLSNYTRDKGWGMGGLVGAIPSMVGGKGITLSHTGKVFPITEESLGRWKGWMRVLRRDQLAIWLVGCIFGVAIPALVSLEFVRGTTFSGNAIAAATAKGLYERTGVAAFWFLTLLCGFVVLFPSQISQADGVIRRWTDVLWTGNRRLQGMEGNKVKYVYYTLLVAYAAWGLLVLFTLKGQQENITKLSGALMNFALGFSAFHAFAVNSILLPRPLRSGWLQRGLLLFCGVFFITISALGMHQALHDVGVLPPACAVCPAN
jgi:hypothetical protein